MSCVLYKGNEKILVSPDALKGLLSQGWTTQPQYPEKPPTAAEFQNFLNLHEELKRVNDAALSARDAQIADLTRLNEQLTEDMDILEAEAMQLRDTLVEAMEELKAFKQQAPAVLVTTDEYDCHEAETARSDYESMTTKQLQKLASNAGVKNVKKFRKHELIKALENGSESEN